MRESLEKETDKSLPFVEKGFSTLSNFRNEHWTHQEDAAPPASSFDSLISSCGLILENSPSNSGVKIPLPGNPDPAKSSSPIPDLWKCHEFSLYLGNQVADQLLLYGLHPRQ